jgi:hypothetical protein
MAKSQGIKNGDPNEIEENRISWICCHRQRQRLNW